MRQTIPIVALVLLLPLLLLWPLPWVGAAELCAAPDQEAAAHAWGLATALRTHQFLVIDTDLLAWPDGVAIVLVDAANLPWFALGWLWGPAVAYNTVLYAGVVLMGVAGALLARHIGGSVAVGAVAAMACPTVLANAADGQTEGFAVAWVGIHLVFLLAYTRTGRWRHGLAAAGALGAAWYGGPYNGVWATLIDLAIGVHLLGRVRRDGWRPVGRAVGVGAAAAVATLPLAWALTHARADHLPGSAARAGDARLVENPEIFRGGVQTGADLLDPWAPIQLTGHQADVSHTAYLGVVLLGLSLYMVARDRRRWPWLAGALAFCALSLGPVLYAGGLALRVGDAAVPGPAALLSLAAPPLARLSRWYRAGAAATLLLSPLAALALRGRGRAPQAAVMALLLIDTLGLAPLAWPLHHSPPPPTDGYAALPDDQPGALLELPQATSATPPPGAWRDASPLAQLWHGRPLGGAMMGFPPSSAARAAAVLVQRTMRTGTLTDIDRLALERAGFRWLAVHTRYSNLPPDASSRLDAAFGPPLHSSAALWLYALPTATTPQTR